MAKARMYSIVDGVKSKRELRGQALQVMDELRANTTPRLAVDIDKVVGPTFKTRQDTLRVTLYYLLVFKKAGLVQATEQVVDTPAETPAVTETVTETVVETVVETPAETPAEIPAETPETVEAPATEAVAEAEETRQSRRRRIA